MAEAIPVITIDGPSGSGKGTVGQKLAQTLNWHFLDSGSLYRVLALAVQQASIDPHHEEALVNLATHLDVQFKANSLGAPMEVYLEGINATETIRNEEYAKLASIIATSSGLREAILELQRSFQQPPGLVADGRDMGTVIFPDSFLKVFLIASLEERAKRRFNQLKDKGINVSLEQVLDELVARDFRDKSRTAAPMKPAPDAIVIDTTGLTIDEVMYSILNEKERRLGEK